MAEYTYSTRNQNLQVDSKFCRITLGQDTTLSKALTISKIGHCSTYGSLQAYRITWNNGDFYQVRKFTSIGICCEYTQRWIHDEGSSVNIRSLSLVISRDGACIVYFPIWLPYLEVARVVRKGMNQEGFNSEITLQSSFARLPS